MSVNVQVSIRCRPFNGREKRQNEACVVKMRENTIYLGGKEQAGRKFNFDHCFDSFDPKAGNFASQVTVYDAIGTQVIKNSFQGFNACVFAYGQTGSGKSYSIMGNKEEPGIVPRLCTNLFKEIGKRTNDQVSFHVETSMIEIYNEKVKDLFNPSNPMNEKGLKVREHPKTGPYVEGLAYCVVKSGEEILKLLDEGNKYRTIAATQMNHTSSRAHTIFTIKMSIRTKVKTITSVSTSRLNLIDLAGSERVAKTGATGQRFKEGTSINLSLICLGNVIEQLAKKSNPRYKKMKKIFVRFRDSTLTWLLKDSLGGNSMTFMIATISPAAYNYPETLSTLRYADRAKKIRTKPKKNEDENARIIRELREEIKKLKELLARSSNSMKPEKKDDNLQRDEEEERRKRIEYENLKAQNSKLQNQLQENEKLVEKLKLSEDDRIKKSEMIAEMRKKELENKFGLVSNIEERRMKVPHIINLAEDPSQSGSLIYFFDKDVTSVGGMEADVKLSGLGIQDFHCEISKDSTHHCKLQVMDENAVVHINGKKTEVNVAVDLFQGDSIIFGNRFVFKYLNPYEVGKKRPEPSIIIAPEEETEGEEDDDNNNKIEEPELDITTTGSSEEEREPEEEDKSISIDGIQLSPIKKRKEPDLSSSAASTTSPDTSIEEEEEVEDPSSMAGADELHKALEFTKEQLVDEYERIREEHLKVLAKEQFSDDGAGGGGGGFNQRQLAQLVESMTRKEEKENQQQQQEQQFNVLDQQQEQQQQGEPLQHQQILQLQQLEQPQQHQPQRRGTIKREAKKWFEQLKKEESEEIEIQKKKASGALEHIRDSYIEDIQQLESVIKALTNTKKKMDHCRYKLSKITKLEQKREEFEYRIEKEKKAKATLIPKLEEVVERLKKMNSKESESKNLEEMKKKRKDLQEKITEIFKDDEQSRYTIRESERKEKEISDTETLMQRFKKEFLVYKAIKQTRKEKEKESSSHNNNNNKTSKRLSAKKNDDDDEQQKQEQQESSTTTNEVQEEEEEEKSKKEDDDDDEEDSELTEEELDEKIEGLSEKLKKLREKLRNLENGAFLRTKNMLNTKKKEAQHKLEEIEQSIISKEQEEQQEENTEEPTTPKKEETQEQQTKPSSIEMFKRRNKKQFVRPPLKMSLSFTFNRQSLINQLLGKKNTLELLELMEKIQQANTISSELGEKCVFSLKVKYSLGDMLYFVQLKNDVKKQITDLPKKVFLERVVWMNDYYNKVLFSTHSKRSSSSSHPPKKNQSRSDLRRRKNNNNKRKNELFGMNMMTYQVPFDENPFHKPFCYSIGSNTLDLSNFRKKREHPLTIHLLDDEMHVTGRLHVLIDDCSGEREDGTFDELEYLYNQQQEEQKEEVEEEIMEGEVLFLRFRVLECDGLPSKFIRDAHIRWTVGDDQEWMESRHVSHNILSEEENQNQEEEEEQQRQQPMSKSGSFFSSYKRSRTTTSEGGKVLFPTGEMFYIQREIFSEEDLFMEIRLFGELFKFTDSARKKHSKFFHNRSISRTRLRQRSQLYSLSQLGILSDEDIDDEEGKNKTLSLSQGILGEEDGFKNYKKIIVSCLKAKKLKNEKRMSFFKKKLNPYCKVKFRETKVKTGIVKGTAFPEWKKKNKLEFKLIDPQNSEVIVVEVMSKEKFMKNILIGRCFVPLSKCEELSEKGTAEWFSLRAPTSGGGSSSGGSTRSKFSGKVKLAFELI